MKNETLELVLVTLSELRDDKKRSQEFARTQITPPLPVPHIEEAIARLESAIADIESTYGVKIVRQEFAA